MSKAFISRFHSLPHNCTVRLLLLSIYRMTAKRMTRTDVESVVNIPRPCREDMTEHVQETRGPWTRQWPLKKPFGCDLSITKRVHLVAFVSGLDYAPIGAARRVMRVVMVRLCHCCRRLTRQHRAPRWRRGNA
ncbi:hypothetical protein J6590_015118 [Homalodisca vitripennis]|nr:hypothetical protein J6590_015118 [Homalodisca vitripennis]